MKIISIALFCTQFFTSFSVNAMHNDQDNPKSNPSSRPESRESHCRTLPSCSSLDGSTGGIHSPGHRGFVSESDREEMVGILEAIGAKAASRRDMIAERRAKLGQLK